MKAIIFFYLLSAASVSVSGQSYCGVEWDESKCSNIVFCENPLFLLQTAIDNYQCYHRSEFDSCYDKCLMISNFGSTTFYPIMLKYKNKTMIPEDEYTPKLSPNEDRRFLGLITYIDVSDNGYNEIPVFHDDMNSLAVIDLSKNSLKIAKLSNIFELPSLAEINFSHNSIKQITYDPPNEYRKLKKIDLSYNYITQIDEGVFDPFDELEFLDISHNYIDVLNTLTFDGIKQLNCLNISNNRIAEINLSLVRFNALMFLDLSNNRIQTIKANDFNRLNSLETLNLNSNFITAIEKDSFHNMLFLKNLNLNKNKLETINKEMLANVSYLNTIDLSENILKNIPRGLFKGKNIRQFSIKDNLLEGFIDKGTFEGLFFVEELDLSSQRLQSIQDFAFFGLDHVKRLLLNNNKINVMSLKCFRMLHTLERLDLSSNNIVSIDFEKDDLYNLLSFSLRKNHLTVVKQENFHGLNSLQYLDLSDNQITQVETNSFKSLKELINFQISNNPLKGTLKGSTFDGLNSLPSLDISRTLLSTIQNGSFIGMLQLKNLNVSHSKINTLEYNSFVHTGAIITIDLSFNELKEFKINSTELAQLETLYLNNNQIKVLDSATFENIQRLARFILSHNVIQNISVNTFVNQEELRALDVSFNPNLNYISTLLNETKNVEILNLSGMNTEISFEHVKGVLLSQLIISNSSLTNVKTLHINELEHLSGLTLSFNNISKLETGDFDNIRNLRTLDLSYNKISNIQPGTFKDNIMLLTLNVSHNYLTTISYGIFHGLIYLNTLDISYNEIVDLQNERFYEVKSLSILIADHNKIETINAEEFVGTSLTRLSIGGNPIPCELIAKIHVPFDITAIRLFENNDENINGVTCNKKSYTFNEITKLDIGTPTVDDNGKILLSIRDIIMDHFNNHQTSKPSINANENLLYNITDKIQASDAEMDKKMLNLLNSTTQIVTNSNKDTNYLLNKILDVLKLNSVTRAPPVQVTKDNATYENLLALVNRMKQDMEINLKLDKDSILNEVDAKIASASSHNLVLTETTRSEKLTAASVEPSKSWFTETCVALILVILVGFVLFKLYKSGVFIRRRFSVSTRELPGSMDSHL